jgi:hypothetical protein
MKKYSIILFFLPLIFSCAQKLIEKPQNLIPEDKMVSILKEMTVVNAARSTNLYILKENGVEPTAYVFKKYDVDSIQFVESDRYYASLPSVYESIYVKVEALLEKEKEQVERIVKIKDSLNLKKTKNSPQ